MIQTINRSQFHDTFKTIRPDNFTYGGLNALYNWLEELEPEYNLDVIALCCEFSEYKNLKAFQEDYGKFDGTNDKYSTIESISDSTTVIEIDNTTCDDRAFIIAQF